jgi:predicted alpha/beta superfamily hydrolase
VSTASARQKSALIAFVLLCLACARPSGAAEMQRFSFKPPEGATTVTLTGDWLFWNPLGIPMQKQGDGAFTADVPLKPGRYLYKFVVDGEKWHHDPDNPAREPDTFGGFNSMVTVGTGKENAPEMRSPAEKNAPITFPVADIPAGFSKPWVPVRFDAGDLRYDVTSSSKGQLYLSAKPLRPKTRAGDTSTTALPARQIFVWLPAAYQSEPARRFPVIYLHDGQNVWDDMTCCYGHGGWCLNSLMDTTTTLPAAIMVGIPNSPNRLWEYGLGRDILSLRESAYLRFLRGVVKARIDADFRTLRDSENTTVMGSSMGGVISIFAGYVSPEVYGNVVAMSTAFVIPDAKKHSLIDLLRQEGRGRFRLYLDSGTGGKWQDGSTETRVFAKLAVEKGWKSGIDFLHFEDTGAEHNEAAWRARAWRPLDFVLNADVNQPGRRTRPHRP